MKKRFLSSTLLIFTLALLAMNIVRAQTQPIFRIGVLDDERGPISDGARLAVQELNDAGGVRGADGTQFRLELVIQSTQGGTDVGTAVGNLGQSGVIAVLGPADSLEVANNLPILQTLNVPVLTPATGDTLLASDNSGRLFRIRSAEVYQGRALASYLVTDLQLRRIANVQLELDIDTAASIIGFATAASALGVSVQPSLQVQRDEDIPQIVNQITVADSEIVVTYGDPQSAATLYTTLRESGFTGLFAYNHVDDPIFRQGVPFQQLRDIVSTTTWPFTASDSAGIRFRDNFIRAYGEIPGPIEAAAYDGIILLAAAINLPGELVTNLSQLDNIQGIQGLLRPAQLTRGETNTNAAVVQLGAFGAPEVMARYENGQKVSLDAPVPTPTVAPTTTPDGVVITITQARQNVRSGPSTSYGVIGQLSEGEQAKVIGATIDFAWVVIEFRGQQGWLATYLLDVFGDLNTVPIITPPPTPTAQPTSTATPQADIVIDTATVAPSPIGVNQPFTVSLSVRNAGSIAAGPFAVAATFPPNNVYASAVIGGLAPGQSTIASLSGTFTNTGFYSVVIVADLNNEVAEGNGENNNLFNFSYFINKPILRQGSITLNAGDNIDLEGNAIQNDATWNLNGQQIDALGTAKLGIIPNVTLDIVHWDLINPSIINQTTILRTSMNAGTIIGIITADGNRGVLRVDDIPGNQLKVTFIVFQN